MKPLNFPPSNQEDSNRLSEERIQSDSVPYDSGAEPGTSTQRDTADSVSSVSAESGADFDAFDSFDGEPADQPNNSADSEAGVPSEVPEKPKKRKKKREPLPDLEQTEPISGPGSKKRYLLLCFFVPFVLLLIGFIYLGVYPFGDRQILIMDAWHQYYPFFEELHSKIRSGQSLFYSLSLGMGTNFIALFAYYLASPLNLLAVLVPTAYLREVYALITLLKVAFAGLFCGIYLKQVFRKNDLTVTMFSVCFALCSFMMGYYWNIMWLDTVMLLPLLALGIHKLLQEGKYILYTIVLAASLIANYYIGFIVCIFTAVYFFVLCISTSVGFKKFFVRLGQIALFSVLGILLTAPVTLTAYDALMSAYYVPENFSGTIKLYHSFWEIITQVLAFLPPTYSEGLPNLYTGFLCFLMIYVYLRAPKIRIREKVVYILFLAFLIVSCNVNLLNYIWHGLHYPNMLPYRFSFLFSFLLVIMGYKAFQNLKYLKWFDLTAMFVLYGVFLFFSRNTVGNLMAALNAILFLVYFIILAVYVIKKANRKKINGALAIVLLIEFTIYIFVTMEQVGSSSRSGYINKEEEMTEYLDEIRSENQENDFYRTEFSTWYILNSSPVYDYNGITQFSSTANSGVSWLLKSLGLPSNPSGNRYTYGATTPVANAFLDLKYMLATKNTLKDSYAYTLKDSKNDTALYSNSFYLPLGFMTDDGLTGLKTNAQTPFDRQNEWIKEQTGIRDDVFVRIPVETVGHTNLYVPSMVDARYLYFPKNSEQTGRIKFNYRMPEAASVFAYIDLPGHDSISLLKDNEEDSEQEFRLNGSSVLSLGYVEKDVLLSLRAFTEPEESGQINACVYYINWKAYDKARETLTPTRILEPSSDFYYDPEISDNPLEFQNRLLSLASGVEGKALTPLSPDGSEYENIRFYESGSGIYGYETTGSEETGKLSLSYTMPRDGSLYTMIDIDKAESDNIKVSCGEEETTFNIRYPYVIAAGTYKKGDVVTISAEFEKSTNGDFRIMPYILNEEVFEEAFVALSDEPFTITSYTDRVIKGTVTAKKDGYLYTSIPYETGWSAYVDGVKTQTESLGDGGFVMIPLKAGSHEITLRYLPGGFLPGLIAAAVSAAVFILITVLQKKRRR